MRPFPHTPAGRHRHEAARLELPAGLRTDWWSLSGLTRTPEELADLRKRIEGSHLRTDARRIRRQKAPRRLSREEIVELVQGYRDGFTVYELATQFGIHRETVSGVLERNGVPRRRKPLSSAQIEQACSLHEGGWSLAQVGAELGCDPSTVWRALAKLGEVASRE